MNEDEVATAIGSDWLVIFERFREQIKEAIDNDKKTPKRTDVRRRFAQVRRAVSEFEKKLNAIKFDFAWVWLSLEDHEDLAAVRRSLRDVDGMMERAAEKISAGGGRKRATLYPLSAREICACVVVDAWTLEHGKPPGESNGRIQQICEEYWQACGGPQIGAESDPGNWRRIVAKVLASNNAMRRSIRRRLVQNRGENIDNSVP